MGRALELGKQLLRGFDIIIFGGAERIDGGMEEDLEHRCKIGLKLSEGLVLLLLLFRVIHFVPIGQLSRKGGDLIFPKVTSNDLGLDRLGKFDKERDQPGKVLKLGSFLVVVRQLLEILPSIGVRNMWQDEILAHEASIIVRKMPTGYTFLIKVADELLGGRARIRSLQLLLQIGDMCIPNLEECSHLLILDVSG